MAEESPSKFSVRAPPPEAAVPPPPPPDPSVTTIAPAAPGPGPTATSVRPPAPAPAVRPPAPSRPPGAKGPLDNLADRIFNAEVTDTFGETEQDEEQHATIEGFNSVLLFPELIPPESKRIFTKNLYQSFLPCQRFMSLLLRFPIVSRENDDRTIVFAYNWKSCVGGLYFITSATIGLLTVFSMLSLVSTMLNFPKQPDNITVEWRIGVDAKGKTNWEPITAFDLPQKALYNLTLNITKDQQELRAEEMFFFRRNFAPILIILFLLFHIITADWNLYGRRHFVASYLTFWTDSVEIMQMDAAGDALKFFKRIRTYYFIWFFIFCLALLANFAPVASGAPASFSFLWVRAVWPEVHSAEDFYITILRACGAVMYLYIVLSSKVYVFFFLYICKLLSNACTVWNDRLEAIFTEAEKLKTRPQKCASRTGYDHIFKDYVNLLDLQSGADTLFTNIIESYFSMTIISIVFEVYYLARPLYGQKGEFIGARHFDMYIIGLYLLNSLVCLYLVSTGAAEVGAASAQGLEIIRKQGILGHRSDPEMHLMISLYMSYTGHFDTALTAGGYFILDKPFFISIAGTMISYIIIIFQFQPPLSLDNDEQRILLGVDNENPYQRKVLLMHVENTYHYVLGIEPFY